MKYLSPNCHPGIRSIYTKLKNKNKKQQHALCYSNFQMHMKKFRIMNSQGFITQFKNIFINKYFVKLVKVKEISKLFDGSCSLSYFFCKVLNFLISKNKKY